MLSISHFITAEMEDFPSPKVVEHQKYINRIKYLIFSSKVYFNFDIILTCLGIISCFKEVYWIKF